MTREELEDYMNDIRYGRKQGGTTTRPHCGGEIPR